MINVIVADDDRMARTLLSQMIKANILDVDNVYEAKNGLEALETIKTNKEIDIVVSDIRMPKMSGLEFCREVKKIKREISIIFVTAYAELEYAQKAIDYGVKGFITKPIDGEEFEHLKTIIVECINAKKIKNDNYKMMHLEDIRKMTRNYLLGKRTDMLFDLFDKFLYDKRLSVDIVKKTSLLIVDGFFDYVEYTGNVKGMSTKEQVVEKIISFQKNEDCIDYLSQIVLNMFKSEDGFEVLIANVKRKIDSNAKFGEYKYMSVNELANEFKISRVQLGALFKKKYGITIKEYITNTRLEHAKYLLKNTDYKINDIANIIEYSDFTGFYKAFKRYVGMSPAEYRKDGEITK